MIFDRFLVVLGDEVGVDLKCRFLRSIVLR